MTAGRMQHRVTFLRRGAVDDGYGNDNTGPFAAIAGASRIGAGFKPQFGREKVSAGRLDAPLSGTLTVRRSTVSAGLTAADRARFETTPYAGLTCNIRSITPTADRRWIELTIEEETKP